jgi:hypothetical protein
MEIPIGDIVAQIASGHVPRVPGNGQLQISRMAMDKRTVVASIVADTAIP